MKRVVIAVISTALAVAIACFGYWRFLYICDRLEADVLLLLEIAETENADPAKLEEHITRLTEDWNNAEKHLDILIQHAETEELDIMMRTLGQLSETESAEARAEYLHEILYRIQHLRETEAPNLQNIL